MLIFFLTTQSEICHLMCDKLTEHSCHVFIDVERMYTSITMLRNPPDLIVVDYTLYNHEVFNLTEYMDFIHYRIPTIFYNEPCLIAGNRPDHWEHVIRLTYGYKDDQNPEEYYKAYERIAEIVEDPDIAQYIPLMQKPKMLPKNYYITKMYRDTSLKEAHKRLIDFKIRTNTPDNLFFIMELLYRSDTEPLSLEEMKDEYEKEIRPITLTSLKVQISKLRRILKDNPKENYDIVRRKAGYQLLAF